MALSALAPTPQPTDVSVLTRRARELTAQIRADEASLQKQIAHSAEAAARWTAARDLARVDPLLAPDESQAREVYTTATAQEAAIRASLQELRAAQDVVTRRLQAATHDQRAREQTLVAAALQKDFFRTIDALADALAKVAALHQAQGALVGKTPDIVAAVARSQTGFNARVARRAQEIRDQIIAIDHLSTTSKEN